MASVQATESVATTVVMRPDAPQLPKQYKEKRYKHNWRLDMLAVPKGNNEVLELFKMTQTQRDAFLVDNYSVQPKVEIPLTPAKSRKKLQQMKERKTRMNDLAIFPKRYYNIQKKTYTYLLGNKFEKRMNKHMKEAHDSIYNEYDRARIELKRRQKNKLMLNRSKSSMKKPKSTKSATSSSSGKSRKKMTHEELLDEAIQWCKVNAKPKKDFPPPKINRGKIADLTVIGPRMLQLACPMHVRHAQDSLMLLNLTRLQHAMKYKISARVLELSVPNPHKLKKIEELIPGSVARGALKSVASPRTLELAVPKARSASKDADFNENAFTISPTALKYVATQRILDLAKPIDR